MYLSLQYQIKTKSNTMGLTFRKSFGKGPFRINLSTRGIGVSTGVKGFRVSAGPRGVQLNASSGPFRYRKTLVSPSQLSAQKKTSVSHYNYNDTDRDDTIGKKLNVKLRLINTIKSFTPFSFLVSFVFLIICATTVSVNSGAIAFFFFVLPMAVLLIRKTKVFYPVNIDEYGVWVQTFGSCNEVYLDNQPAKFSKDLKNSGLGDVLVTNIPVYGIVSDDKCIFFLADKVIFLCNGKAKSIFYKDLDIDVDSVLLTTTNPPSDGEITGAVWKYQNKDGSPDGRHKYNHKVYQVKYSYYTFMTKSGFNETVTASKPILDAMADHLKFLK